MDETISTSNSTAGLDLLMYGWEEDAFTENHHVIVSENYLLFTLTLAAALLLQHVLDNLKVQVIPSSGGTILFSIAVGLALRGISLAFHQGNTPIFLNFSTDVFYFVLLPPIIFNSGYHLRRQNFFENLDAILSLAFIGTFASTMIIAFGVYFATHHWGIFVDNNISFNLMEAIALGALLSSTDPVATLSIYQKLGIEKNLYYLVFGESVLNDAVAITVFKVANNMILAVSKQSDPWMPLFMIVNFLVLFVGSSVVGYASALLLALIFKHLSFPNNKIIPLALLLCASFVPFFVAEMLQLSGIVAIFFAGIGTRRYVVKNTKESTKIISSIVFETVSYLAETSCFVFMGLAMVLQDYQFFRSEVIAFIALTFALCLFARIVDIYGLLGLVNLSRYITNKREIGLLQQQKVSLIPHSSMIMVCLAGIRGAVAYALAYDFHNQHGKRQLVISSTSVIILLTILVLGGCTGPLIEFFGVPTDEHSYLHSDSKASKKDFESKYLYPLFLRQYATTSSSSSPKGFMKDVIQLLSPRSLKNEMGSGKSSQSHADIKPKKDKKEENSPLFINTPSDVEGHYEPSSGGGSIHDLPEEMYTFSPKIKRFNSIWSPLRSKGSPNH